MGMSYIIICKSESGDDYFFKSDHIISQEEFDLFVKERIPEEYIEDINYINIYYQIDSNEIPKI